MNLEEHIKCKICEKSLKTTSILRHIGHSPNCHREYPKTELEKLRSAANMRKLSQLKEIKRKTYDSQKRNFYEAFIELLEKKTLIKNKKEWRNYYNVHIL